MRIYATITLAFLFAGCEKDIPVRPDALQDRGLATYLQSFSPERVSEDAIAFAGNHRSFERETVDRPLHIYAAAPSGATDFRLFESDSLEHPDSLQFYSEKTVEFRPAYRQFLVRAAMRLSKRSKWTRLSYVWNDSLFLSPPMHIRATSDTTRTFESVDIEHEVPGKATVRWSDSPSTSRFFLVLSDRAGDVFCAIETRDDSFRFYDLRNVDHNLTPDLYDPRLVRGEHYGLALFGISSDGWIHRYTQTRFTHE